MRVSQIIIASAVLMLLILVAIFWWYNNRAKGYEDIFGEPYPVDDEAQILAPSGGFIDNETIAIDIAKVYIEHHLGSDVMKSQIPFRAHFSDDVWVVVGNTDPSWHELQKTGGRTRVELDRVTGSVVRFVPME